MSDDLVYWSVAEVNRKRGSASQPKGMKCPKGHDNWRVRNGIDPQYKSEYNPGEYVEYTCAECDYSFEEGC
jgi:hypothetical protein